MRRVLLVHPNLFRHPAPVPPSGLARVAGAVRALGGHPAILDLAFVWNRTSHIPAALEAFRPDVIGVGIAHLDNDCPHHPLSFLPQILWILDRLRRPGVPIVVGGAAFSQAPAELLRYLGLRFGVCGSHAHDAAALLLALAGGAEPTPTTTTTSALCWDGRGYAPGTQAATRLHRQPPPAHDLVAYRRHERASGAVAVPVHEDRGHGAEPRGAEEVVDELAELAEGRGVRRGLLAGLALDEAPGAELVEALVRRRLAVALELEAEAPTLDEAAVRALAAAGCAGLRVRWPRSVEDHGHAALERIAATLAAARGRLPVQLECRLAAPWESAASLEHALDALARLPPPTRVLIRVGERSLTADQAPVLWPHLDHPARRDDMLARIRDVARHRPRWLVDVDAYAPWYGAALGLERVIGPWPPWRLGPWLGLPSKARAAIDTRRLPTARRTR